MNKIELSEQIAVKARLTKKDSLNIIEDVFETIVEALQRNEEVKIAGFGTFKLKMRKARQGINPITKEVISLPSQTAIAFQTTKSVKKIFND